MPPSHNRAHQTFGTRLQLQSTNDPSCDPGDKERSKNGTKRGWTTVLYKDKANYTHSYAQAGVNVSSNNKARTSIASRSGHKSKAPPSHTGAHKTLVTRLQEWLPIAQLGRLQLQSTNDPSCDPSDEERSKNGTKWGGTNALYKDEANHIHSHVQAYEESINGKKATNVTKDDKDIPRELHGPKYQAGKQASEAAKLKSPQAREQVPPDHFSHTGSKGLDKGVGRTGDQKNGGDQMNGRTTSATLGGKGGDQLIGDQLIAML